MEMKLVVNNKKIDRKPDYKMMYHAAFNALTDLHRTIEKTQQDLEDMYIRHTEPIVVPEYIQVAENCEMRATN